MQTPAGHSFAIGGHALTNPHSALYVEGDPCETIDAVFGVKDSLVVEVKDRFDCTQCVGCGFVMSRKAVDDIGGWPRSM